MTKITNKKQSKIVYQCGVEGCCPIIEQLGKTVFIKDDYGNIVKMAKKQLDELVRVYSNKNK